MRRVSSPRGVQILVSVLTASLFLLGGCASKYGTRTTNVHYYPQCYASIDDLRKSEENFNSTVGTGVALGVLSGAVLGLIASGGKAEGAALGAVAGGVVGGAAGYATAESAASAEDNRLMSKYLSQIDGDITGINRVTAAGRLAVQCYDRQFKLALADFKARRISKAELQTKYQEIKSGTLEAQSIMGETLGNIRTREDDFRNAVAEEARRTNRPVPVMTQDQIKSSQSASVSPSRKKRASRVKTPPVASSASQKRPVNDLEKLAQKTDSLSASRVQLEKEYSAAENMQQSWADDLAAIKS